MFASIDFKDHIVRLCVSCLELTFVCCYVDVVCLLFLRCWFFLFSFFVSFTFFVRFSSFVMFLPI